MCPSIPSSYDDDFSTEAVLETDPILEPILDEHLDFVFMDRLMFEFPE
jgi:hypothetical protein